MKKIVVIIVLILGVAFYWYEVRPSGIRVHCAEVGSKIYSECFDLTDGDKDSFITRMEDEACMEDLEKGYKICLRTSGLKE